MAITGLQTIDRLLKAYLAEMIAIPATARSNASNSQNYLRQVLRNKANVDAAFPELLTRKDSDFVGGSFARHTKIWPLDDIDIFLPLEGGGLSYLNNGFRLPYSVVSDGGAGGRLTQNRWQTNGYVDSVKVLNGFRDGLRDTYPTSIIKPDNHCVNFQTTIAATTESEGIGFDVVPCFRLDPDDHSESFYLVPDGTGSWMRSNPRKDTDLCATLQDFHGTYRQAVRLVKHWNKTQVSNVFPSYYIELAMSKRFLALKQGDRRYWCLLQALACGMAGLKGAYTAGDLTPFVSEAPAVRAPVLTDTQRAILDGDLARASTAFRDAYQHARIDRAFDGLNVIFGTGFFQ
jgi:hypothetical protein